MEKKIIVLVGPSGSGKTTIGDRLSEQGIKKLVTTTTRTPRIGETDGVDYYFKEKSELNSEDFLEQTEYNNEVYGLTKAEIEKSLKEYDVVHVSLDRNGSKAVKEAYPDQTIVFFITISKNAMIERMKRRGDSEEKILERINYCDRIGELIPPAEADYVIDNRDINSTVREVLNTIIYAETNKKTE